MFCWGGGFWRGNEITSGMGDFFQDIWGLRVGIKEFSANSMKYCLLIKQKLKNNGTLNILFRKICLQNCILKSGLKHMRKKYFDFNFWVTYSSMACSNCFQ